MYLTDIEKTTVQNKNYRRVLYTTPNRKMQLTVMSIKPGGDVGLEMHDNVEQFFRIDKGQGRVLIGKDQGTEHPVKDGSGFIIPSGTWHNVVNDSPSEPLQLYSIYTPANHPDGLVQKNKPTTDHHQSDNNGWSILVLILLYLMWNLAF